MQDNFIEVAVAYLCGIVIPGPSIVLIARNGILYSRMSSVSSAIGIVIGIAMQSALVLTMVSFIDTKHSVFVVIKVLCIIYLLYLGFKNFFYVKNCYGVISTINENQVQSNYANNIICTSFKEGLLLELLNPMAFTFFISIFATIINHNASYLIKFGYLLEVILLGSLWFCGFAYCVSIEGFIKRISRFFKLIGIISGGIFLLFGIRMSAALLYELNFIL